ncbi:hypothetical protein ACQ4PT_055003 [Festuca glaucescens]
MPTSSASSLRASGGVVIAPSMFASAIIAKAASGSHVLKIDGCSRTTLGLGTFSFITSRSFEVGGHRWCLRYYPDGHNSSNDKYISIILCLDPSGAGEVRAQYKISLLDQEEQPVPGCVMGRNTCSTFSAKRVPGGSHHVINNAVLENPDDAFSVRCDINVVMGITTEDVVLPAAERGIKKEAYGF